MSIPTPESDRDNGWAVRYEDVDGTEKTTEPGDHQASVATWRTKKAALLPKVSAEFNYDKPCVLTIHCPRSKDLQFLRDSIVTWQKLLAPRVKLVNLVDEARAEAQEPRESLGPMEIINRQGQKTDVRSDS